MPSSHENGKKATSKPSTFKGTLNFDGKLMISCHEGDEVVIGDPNNPIGLIRVEKIKGSIVRIGLSVDRSVGVYRAKIANDILSSGSKRKLPAAP